MRERVADGEGRGDEHRRLHGVEQELLELRRDVDRRRPQLGAPEPVALRPHDRRRVVAAVEDRLEREGQAVGVAGERVGLLAAAPEPRRDPAQRGAHAVCRAGGQPLEVARGQPDAPGRERTEQPLAVQLQRAQVELGRVAARGGRGAVDVAGEARQHLLREPHAERVGGRVLELVRLVEDHQVVRWQDRRAAAGARAQREVGHVEGVVDEHDVDLARAGAGGLAEAPRPLATGRPPAAIRADGELVPHLRGRQVVQLVAVARARRQHPLPEAREGVVQPEVEPPARRRRLGAAQVVGAPLDDGRGQRATGRHAGQRQVAGAELILQRAGRGRDDHAPAGERRGDEVGEALADAGAGLGDEVPLAGECARRPHPRARSARDGREMRGAPTRAPTRLRGSARR